MKIKLCSLVSVKTIILLRMRRSDVKMDSENERAVTDRADLIMMFRHAGMDTAELIRHSRQSEQNACRLSGDACGLPAPSSFVRPCVKAGRVRGGTEMHKVLGCCLLGSPRLKPSIKACCPGER